MKGYIGWWRTSTIISRHVLTDSNKKALKEALIKELKVKLLPGEEGSYQIHNGSTEIGVSTLVMKGKIKSPMVCQGVQAERSHYVKEIN